LRIVLDTNVVLSALLWRGKPYRLLEVTRRSGDIRLVSSPMLLAELADYLEIVEVVEPNDAPRVVPADADDDHVIAAAVASNAALIVSGDSDLLSMGSHKGINILSAAMAIEQIGGHAIEKGKRPL
jgi:uncharacterized protein